MSNIAQRVREQKEQHPENFCPVSRCLWRTNTREGYRPCEKHPPGNECQECNGSGHGERYSGRLDEAFTKCRYCNGTGKVRPDGN